ncbi:MAG: hypothetical protein ACREI3_05690 [Nitrospirales bacterium]
MGRYRSKRNIQRLRSRQWRPGHPSWKTAGEWANRYAQALQVRWDDLPRLFADRASRSRLSRLVASLTGPDRGARESALAELELAILLLRAGFEVGFLPESQAKTADLKCRLDAHPLFVEVTTLSGAIRRAPLTVSPARPLFPHRLIAPDDHDEQEGQDGTVLADRLVARIAKKARQLASYQAPVVLAITVPQADRDRARRPLEVDLARLTTGVTLMLPGVRHISAVLLSLWDVEPTAARSGVRLANVTLVQRSAVQTASPRVRMLILNPAAQCPLRDPEGLAFKHLL